MVQHPLETIYTDDLGSIFVVTDESGMMTELLDHNPFGMEISSWSSTSEGGEAEFQKTYIGEYSDKELGQSNFYFIPTTC